MTAALGTRSLAAPAALLGSGIGVYAGIRSLSELPPWVIKLIETQAVGMLGFFTLLAGMIYFAPQLVGALQQQALAMNTVAEMLKNLPQKDHMKFEEILIGQQMMMNSVQRVHERLNSIEGKLNDGQPPLE